MLMCGECSALQVHFIQSGHLGTHGGLDWSPLGTWLSQSCFWLNGCPGEHGVPGAPAEPGHYGEP